MNGECGTVLAILALPPPASSPETLKDPVLLDYCKRISFPTNIFPEFKNLDAPLLDKAAHEINQSIPFSVEYLDIIINSDFNDEELEFVGMILLYYFVSWKLAYLSNKNFDNYVSILKAMVFTSNPRFSYSKSALGVFIELCILFVKDGGIDLSESVFSQILDLVMKYPQYWSDIERLMRMLLKKVMRPIAGQMSSHGVIILEMIDKILELVDCSKETANAIVTNIALYIGQLNTTALHVFGLVGPLVSHDVFETHCLLLTTALFTRIDSQSFIDVPEYETTKLTFPDISVLNDTEMMFIDKATFKTDINMASVEMLAGSDKFIDIECPFVEIIHGIASIAQKSEKAGDYLFDYFLSQPCTHVFNVLYVCIAFMSELNLTLEQSAKMWEWLMSTKIMDEKVSSFDGTEYSRLVGKMRDDMIEAFARSDFLPLPIMISSLAQKPVLFSETIQRVNLNFSRISKEALRSPILIKTMATSIVCWQKFHINASDENRSVIEATRKAMFGFLSNAIGVCADEWFASLLFVPVFFSFFFEDPTRTFACEALYSYLAGSNNFNISFLSSVTVFVDVVNQQVPDSRYTLLLRDFFVPINRSLLHKTKVIHLVQDLHDSVPTILQRLSCTKECHELLIELIQFLSFAPNKCPVAILKSTCSLLSMPEYHDTIELKLLQIAAGKQRFVKANSFTIRYPELLWVCIANCHTSDEYMTMLETFKSLFSFSLQNRYMANKANVGLALTNIVSKDKYSTVMSEYTTMALSIIDLLHETASSQMEVQKYLSLLAPNDDMCLPVYHPHILKSITLTASTELYKPTIFTPLSSKGPSVVVSGIPGARLNGGFVVVAWVFPEKSNTSKRRGVFTLYNDYGRSITLVAAGNNLSLYVEGKKSLSRARLSRDLIPEQWNIVSLVAKEEDRKGQYGFTIRIMRDETSRIICYWDGFDDTNVSIATNLSVHKGEQTGVIGYLGSIALMRDDKNANFHFEWQNLYSKMPDGSLVSIVPIERDLMVDVKITTELPDLAYRIDRMQEKQSSNMREIITDVLKIDSVLPLLAQSGLPLTGTKNYNVSELVIDVLVNLLAYRESRTDQSSFISVLSLLLMRISKHDVTYALYTRLTGMIELIDKKQDVKDFFSWVILNYSLWKRGDVMFLNRIVKHWKRSLLPDYTDMFDFEKMLFTISEVDEPTVMRTLCEIIVQLGIMHMTTERFQVMIGVIMSTPNLSRVLVYLSLITGIFSQRGYEGIDTTTVALLHNLIGYHDEDITLAVVDVILVCADMKEEHFGDMFCEIASKYCTESFLQKLLDRHHPSLFSTVCQIAMNINAQQLVLDQTSDYVFDGTLIPLISLVAFLQRNDIEEQVFKRLANSEYDIVSVMCAIEMSCKLTNRRSRALDYAFYYMSQLPSTIPEDLTIKILRCVYKFIMSVSVDDQDRDFVKYCCSQSVCQRNETKLNIESLIATMSSMDEKQLSYQFGLRIENGVWLDYELAKLCMVFFLNLQKTSYQMLACDVALAMFSMKCDQGFAMVHIRMIQKYVVMYPEIFQYVTLVGIMDKVDFGIPLPPILSPVAAYEFLSHMPNIIDIYNTFASFRNTLLSKVKEIRATRTHFLNLVNLNIDTKACELRSSIITESDKRQIENKQKWKLLEIETAALYGNDRSKNLKSERIRFKRDQILCGNGVPMKLKVNHSFDDHMAASVMRDTKDAAEAQKIIDENRRHTDFDNIYREELDKKDTEDQDQDVFTQKLFETDKASLQTSKGDIPCRFTLTKSRIVLITAKKTYRIPLKSIETAVPCPRAIVQSMLQIVTKMHMTFCIGVDSVSTLQSIVKLMKLEKPKKLTEEWIRGEISNFEYLLNLNTISGRSFHNIYKYPFMPWIIGDYSSAKLDLTDPKVFRDLSKPVGALDPEQLKERIENISICGYMYDCGPMSPMTLSSFLVRMEPFTSLYVGLNGGKFEDPNRIFTSIENSYKMAQKETPTELIPEFFAVPEFLENRNNFDLGLKERNGDVELPAWAENPLDFVYQHRKALESDYVSQHLNHWIDLFFGVYQADSYHNNLYPPYLYTDFKDTSVTPLELDTLLKQCGQMPPRLFEKPHPVRAVTPKVPSLRIQKAMKLRKQLVDAQLIQTEGLIECYYCTELGEVSSFKLLFENEDLVVTGSMRVGKVRPLTSMAKLIGTDFIIDTDETRRRITIWELSGRVIVTKIFYGEVHSIHVDEQYIMVITDDASATFWRVGEFREPLFVIESSYGPYTCGALRSSVDAAVLGTSDAHIEIVSLRTGKAATTVNLGERIPKHICISGSFGFILVNASVVTDTDSTLTLFTINGTEVKSTMLSANEQVLMMKSFTNSKGFDHALIQTSLGRILAFEMYQMDPASVMRSITACGTVWFVPNHRVVIHIGVNGRVVVAPLF